MSEQTGFCECGCGQRTTISPYTSKHWGYVKGEPRRFARGHQSRSSPVDYIVNEQTGCWEWQLACKGGYGVTSAGTRQVLAHRAYYERAFGPIPAGRHLHHTCHNKRCVNPRHLKVLTVTEHNRLRRDLKLSLALAHEIRASEENQYEIAERLGISQTTVSLVRNQKAWVD